MVEYSTLHTTNDLTPVGDNGLNSPIPTRYSPQCTSPQDGEATYLDATGRNGAIVVRHLSEITVRRQALLEGLANT